MRVLAVDPGGTTGWVIWSDEVSLQADGSHIELWGEDEFETFIDLLDDEPCSELDAILAERYTITPNTIKKSRQYEALELIGVLRAEAYRRNIPFVLQQQNPPFCTDAKLRVCGLYVPGDHGRSAARQLLLYLCRENINPGATEQELLNADS